MKSWQLHWTGPGLSDGCWFFYNFRRLCIISNLRFAGPRLKTGCSLLHLVQTAGPFFCPSFLDHSFQSPRQKTAFSIKWLLWPWLDRTPNIFTPWVWCDTAPDSFQSHQLSISARSRQLHPQSTGHQRTFARRLGPGLTKLTLSILLRSFLMAAVCLSYVWTALRSACSFLWITLENSVGHSTADFWKYIFTADRSLINMWEKPKWVLREQQPFVQQAKIFQDTFAHRWIWCPLPAYNSQPLHWQQLLPNLAAKSCIFLGKTPKALIRPKIRRILHSVGLEYLGQNGRDTWKFNCDHSGKSAQKICCPDWPVPSEKPNGSS